MTLKECYRILQVAEGAPLDAVKRAYRKRAFELHPDLHPDRPDASRLFQQLNEAYVILTRDDDGKGSAKRRTTQKRGEDAEATRDQARKAYEKAKKNFNASQGASGSGQHQAGSSGNSGSSANGSQAGKQNGNRQHATRQEEVLNDILKDPFARRVFEDIYSQVRHDSGKAPVPPKKRKLSLEWGNSKASFDLTHGLKAGVKGWLNKQMDEELTIHLPPQNLRPGARVRISVSQGLSDDKKQIEITLPPDFVVGRPIRLKGLGKKLGMWTGDLYLRILAKF